MSLLGCHFTWHLCYSHEVFILSYTALYQSLFTSSNIGVLRLLETDGGYSDLLAAKLWLLWSSRKLKLESSLRASVTLPPDICEANELLNSWRSCDPVLVDCRNAAIEGKDWLLWLTEAWLPWLTEAWLSWLTIGDVKFSGWFLMRGTPVVLYTTWDPCNVLEVCSGGWHFNASRLLCSYICLCLLHPLNGLFRFWYFLTCSGAPVEQTTKICKLLWHARPTLH